MRPTLKFVDVSVGYPGRLVLSGVSLDVEPGGIHAIVGPNGVGKSTLIKAASGILPLVSGQVAIDGAQVTSMSPSQRARLLAVVPQATQVPSYFSAEQVVLMGRTPYLGWLEHESAGDRAVAADAMTRTHTDFAAKRPMGELSGGEKQRVMVARALAQSPKILLMDEPTAHLDLRHQDETLTLIRTLAREGGLAVLLALHDLNLVARYADHVTLLSDGTVRKMGTPREVLTPDILAEVYGMKIYVMDHPIHGTPLVLTG